MSGKTDLRLVASMGESLMGEPNTTPPGGGGLPPEFDQRLRVVEMDIAVIKSNYARREDIADLRCEIKDGFSGVSSEFGNIREEFGKIHEEFGNTRSEIANSSNRTILWSLGMMVALVACIFAILSYTPLNAHGAGSSNQVSETESTNTAPAE